MTTQPYTAEYADLLSGRYPTSKYTVLADGAKNGRQYRLTHSTAGYEPAGSCARRVEEYWAVAFTLDNARHGKRFATRTAATEHFWRVTH